MMLGQDYEEKVNTGEFSLEENFIGEVPIGIPRLIELGGKIQSFCRFPATIIPAEKKILYEDQTLWGFWNEKVRATKVLTMNI